jgi:hypothetical protein
MTIQPTCQTKWRENADATTGTSPKGAVYPSLERKPQVRDLTMDQQIPPFTVSAGKTLDLSSHLREFEKSNIHERILEPEAVLP